MATAYGGRLQAPLGDRTTARGLSQWLNRLEFVVSVDGSSLFPHRGEKAVVDDASRVRPFGIEWATSESGFSRFFLIVGNLSRSQCGVHTNNNRSLQGNVKDSAH